MPKERTPGPDYYALADGRQFYEYQREVIVPLTSGLSVWDAHCVLIASEHFFRAGAKEGETVTDFQAISFWVAMATEEPDYAVEVWDIVVRHVADERKAVGR